MITIDWHGQKQLKNPAGLGLTEMSMIAYKRDQKEQLKVIKEFSMC